MRRLTASRLWLAEKCLHPWVSDVPWLDKVGPEAAVGTAFHSYAETNGQADLDALAAQKKIPPSGRKKLAGLAASWDRWVKDVNRSGWRAEVPYAFDPASGAAKELPNNGHRNYDAPLSWLVGTADVVEHGGSLVTVSDYKTGAFVEAPFVNPQLRFLSLAAARAHGTERAVARIIKVTEPGVSVLSAEFTPRDLDEIDVGLRVLDERRTANEGPRPGAWCRFCPARDACPEVFKPEERAMAAATTATTTTKARGLSAIRKGRIEKPVRVLLYGVEGIGKSTFAAAAPSPIFVGAEDGTAQLDVHRFPEPERWEDVFADVAELTNESHDYRTLVVDTVDWAEPLCWDAVCRAGGKKHVEDFGFGKGYVAALEEWRRLLSALDGLRERKGMNIVLLAHSKVATFKNPEGDDYDRYALKLHEKSGSLLKEWSDAVMFAQYETFTHEKNGRVRGIGSGARILHTQHRAAFDAKNRFDLPETLPLSWDEFVGAIKARAPQAVSKLREQYDELVGQVPADIRAKAEEAFKKLGDDPAGLAKLVDRMRGKVQIESQQNQKESA